MSPTAGVSFLERAALQNIQQKPGTRVADDMNSFLGNFIRKYSESGSSPCGTQTWPVKSAEWFIVDMLTQLLITPHGSATGRTVPEIQNAYLPLVRDLVSVSQCTF